MNSILSLSPTDNRCFSAEIASALEDINAAVIIQQLHYWMGKENVGVIVDGIKYIYNSFPAWITHQFKWLSSWQFRKSMTLLRNLGIVKVIRYKARQYNQTNYYTLNYDVLREFLKSRSPESTETVELCVTTDRDERIPQIELRDSNISIYDSKNTIQKETTEQTSDPAEVSSAWERARNAVAFENEILDGDNSQEDKSAHSPKLKREKEDNNVDSLVNKKDIGEDKSSPDVDYIVNKNDYIINKVQGDRLKMSNNRQKDYTKNLDWKLHKEELDNLGLQLNSTVLKLIKENSSESVERAIAFLKLRKRDNYIENPTGYFVQALKENWSSESSTVSEKDKFRYWYSLARELGHVTGAEIRDGEQWVCFTGTWSRYQNVVERGHTIEYLKKVINKYKNR